MNCLSFFNSPSPQSLNREQLQDFLIQQGFFHDELCLPPDHSSEMVQLTEFAKGYVDSRHKHSYADSITDLQELSVGLLRKPFQELEERQQTVLREFAKLLAQAWA